MEVVWDARKDRANQRSHGLSFEEAAQLFLSGRNFLEIFDEAHSDDEDRFIAIGPIEPGVIVVIFTEPAEDVVRIISARRASAAEARLFREYLKEHR